MEKIIFVPGAITAGLNITIPTNAPDIRSVVAAEITRVPSAISAHAVTQPTVADTEVVAALAEHAAHNHDFKLLAGKGGGAGTAAVVGDTTPSIGGLDSVIAGANSATEGGVAEGAAMAHGGSGTPANCDGGAVAVHTGTDPVVAAVPTKVDATHITLDVDTELGDLLTLWYNAVGFLGPEP